MLLFAGALLSNALAHAPGPELDGVAEMDVPAQDTATPEGGAACTDQYLRDGVQLPARPGLFVITSENSAWGTATMIDTILHASEELAWQLPDADPFVVGDISAKRGGYFEGHRSHRGGVDADLGIYSTGAHQNSRGFQDLTPADFDAHATWTFMRILLDTGKVDRIYLDQSLINVLRRYVHDQEGLSAAEVDRIFPPPGTAKVWSMTGVVQHVAGHRNHMHLRVLCDNGVQAQ